MKAPSGTRSALAVAAATLLGALTLLAPDPPPASAADERRDCALPAWIHAFTGHWGGADCR